MTFGVERLVALDWNVDLYGGIIHGECASSVWRALPLLHSPSYGGQPSLPLLSQPLITLNYYAFETLGRFIYYQSSKVSAAPPLPFQDKPGRPLPVPRHWRQLPCLSEHLSATLAADTIFIIVVPFESGYNIIKAE